MIGLTFTLCGILDRGRAFLRLLGHAVTLQKMCILCKVTRFRWWLIQGKAVPEAAPIIPV